MVLCGLLLFTLIPGCGGCSGRDKGKNSDFDRPKEAEKK
jgi:hypothetical protein